MTDFWQYTFPPFFTIQPNEETRRNQMNAWCEIILDYCRRNRIFVLNINECLKKEPFRNDSIGRSLTEEALSTILDDMAQRGRVEWIGQDNNKHSSEKSSCLVYWFKVDEWANILIRWVEDKALNHTVCTFYEIVSDEDKSSKDLFGLDERILLKTLKYLEKQNKVAIMTIDGSYGVKFL